MSERILTQHPEPGKQGANIARDKYDIQRVARSRPQRILLVGNAQDAHP